MTGLELDDSGLLDIAVCSITDSLVVEMDDFIQSSAAGSSKNLITGGDSGDHVLGIIDRRFLQGFERSRPLECGG
jgi:hypothetical protein